MSAEAQMYRTAVRVTVVTLVALAVVGAVVGWLVDDARGVVGALTGVGIAALAGLSTQVTMLVGHRMSGTSMAALMMGSWLVKMVLVIAALAVVRGLENFPKELAGAFLVAGIVASLAIDVWALQRTRVPYVEPGSN